MNAAVMNTDCVLLEKRYDKPVEL